MTHVNVTQDLLDLSRGTEEIVKRQLAAATALDSVAGVLAVLCLLTRTPDLGLLYPGLILVVAAISATVRLRAQRVRMLVRRGRRAAMHAFALREAPEASIVRLLREDSPRDALAIGRTLPDRDVEAFWEPGGESGPGRLQKVYAHSAFVSWRLLRSYAFFLLAIGIAVFLAGIVGLWLLARTTSGVGVSLGWMADVVCSTVLVTFGVRVVKAGVESIEASSGIRSLYGAIMDQREGVAREAIVAYDMERASGPWVPTWLYRMNRSRLRGDWRLIRETFQTRSEPS